MNKTLGTLIVAIGISLAGCEYTHSEQASRSGATQAAPSQVRKNSKGRTVEQQNIDDRNKVTEDSTKILWIHLIAIDGKIIRRMPVVSKVTSSGKRLEAKHFVANNGNSSTPPISGNNYTDELIGPDGTFGDSDPYIYWFDPQHRYHQWGTAGGLGYLLTDYPIDLKNPIDEITGMYNVSKLAAEWQAVQETSLKGAK
jgi:hypothetical protein